MRACVRVAALAVALTVAATAWAEPSPEIVAQAKEQFARGLQAVATDDYGGALAAFQQAYRLAPNPTVLANVALAQAALGQFAEAYETTDRLLSNPAGLPAERVERMRKLRSDLDDKTGQIEIEAGQAAGVIEVDGLSAGTLPRTTPLRVSIGKRVIGFVATGYIPQRKAVMVGPRTTERVAFELVRLDGRPAQLTVRSTLVGVEVKVDDQPVGRTPLGATVALAPGRHRVRGERSGYRADEREVTLGEGGLGEVELRLAEDAGATTALGLMRVRVSEPQALVLVDDRPVASNDTAFSLPEGPHQLRVERQGFRTHERQVLITQGQTLALRVQLSPTAEFQADYASKQGFRRWLGIGLAVGGGALALGSGGYLLYQTGRVNDARKARDTLYANPPAGCIPGMPTESKEVCDAIFAEPQDLYSARRANQRLGFAALGVGVAAAAVGVTLILLSDDPHRYDLPVGDAPYGGLRRLDLSLAPGHVGVSGAF